MNGENRIQGRKTPQETFGEMLRICLETNRPEAFRGDLYHDAMWLQKHFDEAVENGGFWWSLRQHGTAINIESRRNVDSGGTGETIYFIELSASSSI